MQKMKIIIVDTSISVKELSDLASELYGDMVKAVADIEEETVAFGGEFHADAEAQLLERGSKQEHLWGFNIYPQQPPDAWIEFISLINIRPHAGNTTHEIQNETIRKKITQLLSKKIKR